MAKKQIIHKSMRGKAVDMNKLMNQNEMTLAVGNAKVNARGDEIGPGGKIISNFDNITTPGGMGIQNHQPRPAPAQAEVVVPPKPAKQVKEDSNDVLPAGDA
jgi:hypothetical protein